MSIASKPPVYQPPSAKFYDDDYEGPLIRGPKLVTVDWIEPKKPHTYILDMNIDERYHAKSTQVQKILRKIVDLLECEEHMVQLWVVGEQARLALKTEELAWRLLALHHHYLRDARFPVTIEAYYVPKPNSNVKVKFYFDEEKFDGGFLYLWECISRFGRVYRMYLEAGTREHPTSGILMKVAAVQFWTLDGISRCMNDIADMAERFRVFQLSEVSEEDDRDRGTFTSAWIETLTKNLNRKQFSGPSFDSDGNDISTTIGHADGFEPHQVGQHRIALDSAAVRAETEKEKLLRKRLEKSRIMQEESKRKRDDAKNSAEIPKIPSKPAPQAEGAPNNSGITMAALARFLSASSAEEMTPKEKFLKYGPGIEPAPTMFHTGDETVGAPIEGEDSGGGIPAVDLLHDEELRIIRLDLVGLWQNYRYREWPNLEDLPRNYFNVGPAPVYDNTRLPFEEADVQGTAPKASGSAGGMAQGGSLQAAGGNGSQIMGAIAEQAEGEQDVHMT